MTIVRTTLVFAVAVFGVLASLPEGLIAQGGKPDKILYTSMRMGAKVSIYSMNPDGSGQAQLSKGDAIEMDPVWSPDGKKIAFVVMNAEEMKADIHVMNADGSGRTQLTKNAAKSIAFSPTWSPDGKRIAFSAMQMDEGFGPPKEANLFVVDADGKNLKPLGEPGAVRMMPAWSPDGKQILYTSIEKFEDFDPRLHVMDADGKNAKPLLKGKAMMGAWSPDGKKIVFMHEVGERKRPEPPVIELFVANPDGSNPTQLTKTEGEMEISPVWSADGKRIFFNRISPGGPPEAAAIYVMDADGKNVKQLTKEGMNLLGGGPMFMMSRAQEVKKPQ